MFEDKNFPIKIRRYTPEDADAVQRVNEASLEISFRYYYNLFHRREPDLFLVAEHNNEIIGFVLVKNGTNFGERATAIIFAIAVAPQYRSLNVGARLVNTIINTLKKKQIRKLFLHVRVGNEKGIHFYEKLGFNRLKRIEGFYSWGEAAYRMVKILE
ncbi:MAG: GNAT family N-acetyltransferase [Candidatus Helarchaeota archaeon]